MLKLKVPNKKKSNLYRIGILKRSKQSATRKALDEAEALELANLQKKICVYKVTPI
uniref:Uncharacterized protein n=1 Tax=Rhizophagus irregularis (strain DAOM 181602 / DAOM 197198 / MUCL 43194) TaxID=747089 RepID=U9UWV2_RHIID